jgi:hypothetical protein
MLTNLGLVQCYDRRLYVQAAVIKETRCINRCSMYRKFHHRLSEIWWPTHSITISLLVLTLCSPCSLPSAAPSVRCGASSILDVFPPLNFSVHIRIAPKLMPYRSMASSYSVPTGKSSSVDCQWELNTFGSGFLPSAYDIGRATADQTRASRTISWGRILSVVFF